MVELERRALISFKVFRLTAYDATPAYREIHLQEIKYTLEIEYLIMDTRKVRRIWLRTGNFMDGGKFNRTSNRVNNQPKIINEVVASSATGQLLEKSH